MSDRKTHHAVAALVGLGIGVYVAHDLEGWPALARIVGAVLGSMVGGSLPDALEPPLHSWHRRSLHSWGALFGTTCATLIPPAAVQRWISEREAAAVQWRTQREALPPEHPERARLWLAEMFQHFSVAAALGLPAGYASHLVLDAASPRGLPPV